MDARYKGRQRERDYDNLSPAQMMKQIEVVHKCELILLTLFGHLPKDWQFEKRRTAEVVEEATMWMKRMVLEEVGKTGVTTFGVADDVLGKQFQKLNAGNVTKYRDFIDASWDAAYRHSWREWTRGRITDVLTNVQVTKREEVQANVDWAMAQWYHTR